MPPLYSVVAVRVARITRTARSSSIITRPAIIASATDVTVVAVVASPASKVPAIAVAIVIAVTAEIRPAIELRAAIFVTVGSRPAVVSVAIEIKLSALIAIEVRPAISIRRAAKIRSSIKSATSVSVLSSIEVWPPIEVWTVEVTRRRAIKIGASTPPVTVPIKITVAVIAVPIIAYAEDNGRDSKRAIIFGSDINTPALIHRLNISSGDPTATTVEFDVTPWHVSKATMDLDRFAKRDNGNCGVARARTCTHIDVRRRIAFGGRGYRRRQQEKAGCADSEKCIFHIQLHWGRPTVMIPSGQLHIAVAWKKRSAYCHLR